jgi:hypothetical protein
MKKAWLSLLALTVAGSIGAACTVTTTTDDGNEGGASGSGGSGTGGAKTNGGVTSNGGATTGGATATGGVAATGGTSTTGGTGGAAVIGCDEKGKVAGTPATSCQFAAADSTFCHECLTTSCCGEVKACFGQNPDNQCAYGGPEGESEFGCYEACLVTKAKANGGDYTEEDQDACIGMCSTPACGVIIGDATLDLIVCMHTECEKVCFEDPAK